MEQDDIGVDQSLTSSACDQLCKMRQMLQMKENKLADVKAKLAAIEEQKQNATVMSYNDIAGNDGLLCHYTGLPNNATFTCLVQLTSHFSFCSPSWAVTNLSIEDQLLITLMKLRHNFTHMHLAYLFKLSVATISNITSTWIDMSYCL